MCTVSIIPIEGGAGLRLVVNRDESTERPPALPPRWHAIGGLRAVWPIDGLAGGTWVAASERGLALALLNSNLPDRQPAPGRRESRGGIIPRLIGAASTSDVLSMAEGIDLGGFEPFRLVAAGAGEGQRLVELGWDGRRLCVNAGASPACFASSGLGDWLVQERLPLFERLVVGSGCRPEDQDAFHAHQWPDRPHVSVLMARPGARTVSVTRVEVRPAGADRFAVEMAHEPVCSAGGPVRARG